ncbi:unnamed protein product [Paramecium octaurelia]|uniref:Uncharacterized protein n=1 Tax=Paramecium octaurelia TaxID=43137 RepID=A0A8S1UVI1_PAROT|nr:unnamed protein product [Paramecium octaurelia]
MQQLQSSLQNFLDQLKENNKQFLELIFPQQNIPEPQKKQITTIDQETQTIDSNLENSKASALLIFHQTETNVIDDMIKEFEQKLAQKLEQQKQFDYYKQRFAQQQSQIDYLKKELQSRLLSKYGPNRLQVEKNKKEIEKYQKMIKKQQQENNRINQLNQKYEVFENALQSIQQSKKI